MAVSTEDVRKHADNPLVFVIILALIVTALQRVGSAIAGHYGSNGAKQFFDGP
jgi:hypothetical protein